VVVVESVHTGDQSTADYGAPASDANGTVADSSFADSAASDSAVSDGLPGDGSAAEWSEIKALFVDDPGTSVQRASGLVERAVEGFMTSLRQRQDSLGSWQEGDATGTEELRKALRGYRSLFDQLEQMSGQFPSRSAAPASADPAVGATPSPARDI